MQHLANRLGVIALLFEVLRQRNCIGGRITKVGVQFINRNRVWTLARQQGSARRIATGKLTVSSIESHTPLGQSVNVRRYSYFISIATQVHPQIISCNKENIGLSCHAGALREGQIRNEHTQNNLEVNIKATH
jgi:hypothetical protein